MAIGADLERAGVYLLARDVAEPTGCAGNGQDTFARGIDASRKTTRGREGQELRGPPMDGELPCAGETGEGVDRAPAGRPSATLGIRYIFGLRAGRGSRNELGVQRKRVCARSGDQGNGVRAELGDQDRAVCPPGDPKR